MKRLHLLIIKTLLFNFAGFTQQFEAITTGAIVETRSDSRSCNFLDINGDGWDDIFISNGPSGGQNNMLYLNNQDGTFTTFTNDPIVQDNSPSDGVTFGDVDNDGDLDAYMVTWYGHRNYFYRNQMSEGSLAFSFEPNNAVSGNTYSETASFGDFNNDGWLDLYTTNSTDFVTNAASIKRNQLFVNDQTGQLERVETGAWVTDAKISRSVQWTDFDNDGDIDLFVSNEENLRNNLYRNDGDSLFTAVTDLAFLQDARSSTGSSWGDVNNDGLLDLFIANYGNQSNQLFINQGEGQFELQAASDLSTDGGCSFGSSFGDFDNDGDLDLIVMNGFCGTNLQNFLYKNDGSGNFTRDTESIADLSTGCSFGGAWGDMNNDGFLDLVIANCKGNQTLQPFNSLFRNLGNDNHWIKFRLEGVVSNRSAIGAKVRVKATIDGEAVWQLREISAQDGYNCQNSLTVHFGLAEATEVDSVLIEWPSGMRTMLENQAADAVYEIKEDINSILPKAPLPLDVVLKIAPNPVQDEAVVELTYGRIFSDSVHLQVLDMNGKVVRQQELNLQAPPTAQTVLAVNSLADGVYVVVIKSGNRLAKPTLLSVKR